MRKSFVRTILFGLAILLGLLSNASAAQAEDAMRYKFKAGDKFSYKMSQKMDMKMEIEGMPEGMKTSMNQTTNMVWHVKELKEDGNAIIEQTIARLRMKMAAPGGISFEFDTESDEEPEGPVASMMAPLLNAITGQAITATMSPRGEVVDLVIPDKITEALKKAPNAAQMGEMFSKDGFKKMIQQGALIFPKDEMKVGTEWLQNFEMDTPQAGMKATVSTKYHYKGQEEVDGKMLDKFAIEITLGFESTDGAPKIDVTSQGSEGIIYFDRSLGRMISSHAVMAMDMNQNAAGKEVNIHIDQTIDMKLVPVKDSK